MAEPKRCPQCRAELPADAPEGLCPKCLLEAGLGESEHGRETAAVTLVEAGAEGGSPARPGIRVRYFGDYELLDEIGRGGMGVIYKARQVSLNRIVAVKMVLAGQLASSADVQRFHTEAEAAASLQHPNIVAIHEVGEHQGQHYFSMDYVEGTSLAEMVRENPLPARRAAGYVRTIAEAIHFAHDKGILHRDLKPSNVLIDRADRPRITDFGLAKRVADDRGLTLSGQVLGTPSYMPPEQVESKRGGAGPHSDVYSLGAVLYDLLTGRPPFQADTAFATVAQVLRAEPAAPRRLNPEIPRDIETVCLKCLEKQPRRRYASAQELADDLDRFLRGEPIHARPLGPLDRLDRWARLRPALAATLMALALFYLFHLVLLGLGTEGEGGFFHWFVTALVATWASAAVAFQRWTAHGPREVLPTYCWAAFDVVMLTLFLWQGDGPRSAMLIAYPLLIAGTALRFRIGLLWLVTGLSAASYTGLVIEASLRRPQLAGRFKDWVIFTLSLLVLAFVQRLLLRRLRAASLNGR